jgi:hypothetical protein
MAKTRIPKAVHPSALLFVAISFFVVITQLPNKTQRLARRLPSDDFAAEDRRTVTLIQKYGKKDGWIITDRPIFAVYAGLPTPPEMAAISRKRIATGNLTAADIVASIRKHRPQLILFNRFPRLAKEVIPNIEKDYSPLYQNLTRRPPLRLYVLNEAKILSDDKNS